MFYFHHIDENEESNTVTYCGMDSVHEFFWFIGRSKLKYQQIKKLDLEYSNQET